MEVHAFPLPDRTSGRTPVVIKYMSDVFEQKLEKETSRLNELRLEALLKLNQMAEAPLPEIAEFAMEEAILLTGSKIGYLGFVNEDESEVTIHAWSKTAMEECRILDKNPVFPVAAAGLWGETVRQRRPIITNDYAAPHPWKKGCPAGHLEITRHLGVPIFDGKKIVIIAGMGNKPSDYNESDVRQVSLLMEGMWRIIQRQRTEEGLRQSEARFRSLFESMAEGVALHELIHDDRGAAVDYRIISTNPAFEKHTGLKGELIHGRAASLVYGTGTAPYLEIYARVAHSGQAYAFETFFPPMDRHFHISVTSPKQGQFVTVFEDITARKLMEEALRRAHETLRATLDTVPAAILDLDTGGRVKNIWNAAAEQMLGWRRDEVLGQFLPSVAEDGKEEFAGFRRSIRSGKPIIGKDVVRRRKDGSPIEYSIYAAPEYDDHGEVIGNIAVLMDITERKRLEEIFKLNESRLEALLKLNQMAAAPLREIASFALEEAIKLTGSTIGYLAFMNKDESVLTMHAWSKDTMAECGIADKPLVYPVETTGLWGEAVRQRRAIITNDYAAPNPWKKGCPEGHVQVKKHMNAPIFDGDKIVIVAGVGNKPGDYDESDVRQLTLLMEGMWRIIQRNRVEEALRENEEKYRGLIETTNTGYVIVDTTGKVLDANPEYVRLTGHGDLGEILGRSVLEWTAEQDREQNAAAVKRCLQEGFVKNLELYYAGRDGRSIPVEINATAITTSGGVKFLSLVRDISDRKQTEAKLRDNEQFLVDIFNSIQDGLSILDPNLNIIRVNPAMEKFGYVQPMVGRKCYEVYHGQSSPCKVCPTQQTLLTGKACRETVKGPPSNPEQVMEVFTFPLEDRVTGEIKAVIEYVRDVTEPRRAELALAEEASRRRLLFEQSRDGIVILDQNGKVYEANPMFAEMLGYSLKEVHQLHVWDWDAQWTREQLLAIIHDTDRAAACFETVHRRKDGTVFDVEISANKVLQAGHNLRFCVCRDISQRKQAEEERLRLSKLESLATLAGGIAHDFNNILTAIMGNISLATLDLGNGDRSRERLAGADRACLQAQTLARQLLTFARGGAPVKKPVSVGKIVTESASFSLRGSQVRCEFSFPQDLWTLEADPGQLNQVFQNLIINAIQAMPMGGIINIRGENLTVDSGSELLLNRGRYVKVSVQDQGVGVPPDHLPKIFDPYFTTKQTGSGLGLATAYSIVKNHQGLISVDSKLGAGAVFNVYLPASDKKLTSAREENRDLLLGKGKILVMDDEEIVIQVLEQMLGLLGYQGKFSKTGNEALELFLKAQESGEAFDAVILDLTVPGGMGGKEVMEKLRQIDPRIKAIVSSGYSDAPIMAEFEKYGFSGIIAKPYKVSELGKVLHKVCNGGE
ncbi:MAG: PAS domain S-box protein [Deltaproteobacteria bacterium]|nr:MAG: PAS domain S-box protein [Deltaproteobacteria bacterium]